MLDKKIVCDEVLYRDEFQPLEVGIDVGKISAVGDYVGDAEEVIDCRGKLLVPGIIDSHVHFRDPGETGKEGFKSGSQAAARGGVTTVVDMPNNKPPVKTPDLFEQKVEIGKRKSVVNFALYAGIPSDLSLVKDIAQRGAVGFKYYMAQEAVDLTELFSAVRAADSLLAVHAEATDYINPGGVKLTSPREYVASRPAVAEIIAVERLIEEVTLNTRLHIAHATLPETIDLVSGKATTEVTPHHLLLSIEEVDLDDFTAVMNPPLRNEKLREELSEIFVDNIDLIASDHAPHLESEKKTTRPEEAKPGLPGVETILPLSLTYARDREIPLNRVLEKLTKNPARLFGFSDRGEIEEGYWADLTVINPDNQEKIRGKNFFSKAKITPFEGREVSFWPEMTIVNGQVVFADGRLTGKRSGMFLINERV